MVTIIISYHSEYQLYVAIYLQTRLREQEMNEMARIAELERQREEEKIQQAKVRVDK